MRVHMPEENPRRKRRTPPRGAGGRFRKRKSAPRRRRRRRNPALATVGMNPRRRRRRSPARRAAPARTVTRYRYRNRTRRHYSRRRRNPRLPFGLGRLMGVSLPSLNKVGFGLFGVIGTQTLPTLIPWMASRNQGLFGYLFELGGLVATATVAGMIGGSSGKSAAAIGGGIRIAYRAAYDFGLLGMIPGGGAAEVAPAGGVAGYIDAPPTSYGGGGMGAFYGEQYGMIPQPAA